MDVICVCDSAGAPYCTEFHVKFRSPLVDEAALSSLGANEDAGLLDMVFPREDDKEVTNAARKAHTMEHPLHNNDRVQISCNGYNCHEVIAFIGPEQFLHFYDDTDGSYAKTPSSNVLRKFHMTLGKNTISCIHMGSAMARDFNIWMYEAHDRLVIMDIDGTITKSDVTGYIQTVYMGLFSYVHEGIVPFLNALKDTYGLHLLYVTARPLAHQRETKLLLEGVRSRSGQGLPDGPLLSNKDRLMVALYREMISKTTMQLKAGILDAVARVFRRAGCARMTPFALGIGNKDADAYAYNLAGLDTDRILIINKSSRIEVWRHQQLAKVTTPAGVNKYVTIAPSPTVSVTVPPAPGASPPSAGVETGLGSGGTSNSNNSAEELAGRRSRSEDLGRPPSLLLPAAAGANIPVPSSDIIIPTQVQAQAHAPAAIEPAAAAVGLVVDRAVLDGAAAGMGKEKDEEKGEFSDSDSDGSTSPMTPHRQLSLDQGQDQDQGLLGLPPTRPTAPSSSRAGSGGGSGPGTGAGGGSGKGNDARNARGVLAAGRGIMRALSHGSQGDATTGTGAAGKGAAAGEYVFQTYGDPRLLQYVHSVVHL